MCFNKNKKRLICFEAKSAAGGAPKIRVKMKDDNNKTGKPDGKKQNSGNKIGRNISFEKMTTEENGENRRECAFYPPLTCTHIPFRNSDNDFYTGLEREKNVKRYYNAAVCDACLKAREVMPK